MPFKYRDEWLDSVRLLNQLAHRFDRLMPPILSDMLPPNKSNETLALSNSNDPMVNNFGNLHLLDENEKHIHFQVEMPGITKENLKLEYHGKTLKWSAHRHRTIMSEDGIESRVSTADYSGSYLLPFKPADVNGKLEHGLLNIVVTKPSLPDESSVVVNVD
jgi:HSP20 family molecular chaperone IbpA